VEPAEALAEEPGFAAADPVLPGPRVPGLGRVTGISTAAWRSDPASMPAWEGWPMGLRRSSAGAANSASRAVKAGSFSGNSGSFIENS